MSSLDPLGAPSSFGLFPMGISLDGETVKTALIAYAFLVVSLTLHEYGHAWTANVLGDKTAERLGRLTLNPIPHLHPIFTVALPLYFLLSGGGSGVLFAAARPVPVDTRNLRNPVRDMMLTSIAGPAMNVLLALLFTAVYGIHVGLFKAGVGPVSIWLGIAIRLNLGLAVFNMLPIPPLDGHRVLGYFLPEQIRNAFYSIGLYGFILLMVLLSRGVLDPVLSAIYHWLNQIWQHLTPDGLMPFGRGY